MTADDRSVPVPPPPPPRLPRLTLRTFRPLLVPLMSLAIAVSIIFVAGQQPHTQPPSDNQSGSLTDVIFDPPLVARAQSNVLTSFTIVRNPVHTMTFTWGDPPNNAHDYQLFFRVSGLARQAVAQAGDFTDVLLTNFRWTVASDRRSGTLTGLGTNTVDQLRLYIRNNSYNTISYWPGPLETDFSNTAYTNATSTPTPTPTATNTATPTATATPTNTATPTVTPTPRVVMCGNDCPLNGYSRNLADAVVRALDEASSYEGVTASLLHSVTVLQFQPSYLAPADDFRGMDSLERLDIRGHSLPTGDPPRSFFAGKGLDMLRILHLGDRQASPAQFESYRAVLPALEDLRFSSSSAPVDIFRIEPNIRTLSVRTGDEIRLSVHVYGGQDKRDDSLGDADTVSFAWSSGGGSFSESAPAGRESNGESDDRKVLHTVPDIPGTYKVTASLDGSACAGNEDQCKAEFTIIASRSVSVALSPTPVPCVLSGTVPSVLSDSSNVQYSVFTPADGGIFLSEDDGADVTAGAGSVPGCEYIGVRMDIGGDAEDLNRAGNRYTLAGGVYSVTALDSSGNEISDYEFSTPVQVCVPLPVGLRGSITELGMASINDDDSLTLLTHRIVSASDGAIRVCGALGSLPADVAAAKRGEPESPTPAPSLLSPTPESPDTGGSSVPYSWVLLIAVLGVGVIMLGSATLGRRNRHLRT